MMFLQHIIGLNTLRAGGDNKYFHRHQFQLLSPSIDVLTISLYPPPVLPQSDQILTSTRSDNHDPAGFVQRCSICNINHVKRSATVV